MTDENKNDQIVDTSGTSPKGLFNAWFILIGDQVQLNDFSVTLNIDPILCQGVQEGDAVLNINNQEGEFFAVSYVRVYRKRLDLGKTTIFFDGIVPISPYKRLHEIGFSNVSASMAPIIGRLDCTAFENSLKQVCNMEFSSFPILTGENVKEQAYIRELLQYAVMDDLLGPAEGPFEEIIGMSVRDRYLVGKLAPRTASDEQNIEGLQGQITFEENAYGKNAPNDLMPLENRHHLPGEEFASTEASTSKNDEDALEVDSSTNHMLVPSSLGFTFCIDRLVEDIELHALWGRYIRCESESVDEKTGKPFRAWRRTPSGGVAVIPLNNRDISPFIIDKDCPEVLIQGTVSAPLENGDRLITIFMVNTQPMPEHNQDEAWVFQPELRVCDSQGRAIFRRRPVIDKEGLDDEREALEMIYRNKIEFAVGHGVSVHATALENNPQQAVEIRTCILPYYEVPITETPGLEADDRPAMQRMVKEGFLDMKRLSEMTQDELISVLSILTDDYRMWIDEQKDRIGTSLSEFHKVANEAMSRCESVLKRLQEGIEVLGSNTLALEAFRFANQAMALQRVHSIYALLKRRGDDPQIDTLDIPKNRSWRPFQLAFMLLSIPALANPVHKDRTEPVEAYADLLWFPTGGGKTEAYLGVAAFTMAIRRIQGNLGGFDASRGLAVIMRYTLRLLTLQQFQRASSLICAMEVLRRQKPKVWGEEPFTIGLWVGIKVTPNTTEDSHEAIEKEREGKRGTGSTPAQLTTCPWCGSEIAPGRDIRVERDIGRTFVYCGDKYGRCEFSHAKSKDLGLPILVVDDEIYRHPPSMLIATVDKFAMMAWRGQIRTLFGRVSQECMRHGLLWPEADCRGNHPKKGKLPPVSVRKISPIRPPDLIIQDEFHLISGPLGTMVGLYETAVDELATWNLNGKAIKPKIIASTATVRKAEEQINNVFLRQVQVFPPHGLDVEDNFFSVQRSVQEKPGRRYLGICSPGSSRPAILIRLYVALLTSSQALFERFGQSADPYMTIVGYFNSLRELGGMRRLAEDDVQTRAYRVAMSNVRRPGLIQRSIRNIDELTSRVSNKEIPKKLDQLEVKFKSNWQKGETRAIDVVLATNMLSVGVDVNRLGLMAVNGQPKSTAEYIQATSRVGRTFPGLVCTVLTWSRPRDLSHYETFEHYHATFYKHVEAQSVTPFAPRALDRGLTGTMVSLLRLDDETFNPNTGARQLDSASKPEVGKVKRIISERAWKARDKGASQNAESMTADRIDRWVKEAVKPGRILGYETQHKHGDIAALLKRSGISAWDEFTVPTSMREVEPGVQLIMDVSKLHEPPEWKVRVVDEEGSKK